MYFEYLGIADAGGIVRVSITMFVGPFASNQEREAFLRKCHQAVSTRLKQPHHIKCIPCDQLPIVKADPFEFEVSDDGQLVPARPKQWAAIPPDDFLKIIAEESWQRFHA